MPDPADQGPVRTETPDDPGMPAVAHRGVTRTRAALSRRLAVELELTHGVRPHPHIAASAEPPSLTAETAGVVDALNEALARHRARRLEPSFGLPGAFDRDGLPPAATLDPDRGRFVRVYFDEAADLDAIARELSDLPEVRRAVPVSEGIPPNVLNTEPLVGASDQVAFDPTTGLEFQWYIFRCRADAAWQFASGRDVVIADIDFGFLTAHQDLATPERRFNAYDGTDNVGQGHHITHGTAVMGLAAAPNNGSGMAGFAFEAAKWVIQANTTGPMRPGDAWARAIDFVRLADAGGRRKVILLEVQTADFGNYEEVPSVNRAVADAVRAGVVVCVPAGNGDRSADVDSLGRPIPETGSVLIGATGFASGVNERAPFSNFGRRIAVSAPGDLEHDVTCDAGAVNGYRNSFGGTSGAAPKVAGTVALMLQANPQLTPAEVREILAAGAPVVTTPDKPAGAFLDSAAAVAEAARRAAALT